MIATARPMTKHKANRPGRELGEIQVSTAETTFTLKLDRVAALGEGDSGSICVLSAAGSHTAVKALHACLWGGAPATFRVKAGNFKWATMRANASGYKSYMAKLAGCYGWWQIVAIAKQPGIMPVIDDAALWREFKSEKYTTPILRSFMPWIRDQLLGKGLLHRLDGFRCAAGLLSVTTAKLDEVVKAGVEFGHLKIG